MPTTYCLVCNDPLPPKNKFAASTPLVCPGSSVWEGEKGARKRTKRVRSKCEEILGVEALLKAILAEPLTQGQAVYLQRKLNAVRMRTGRRAGVLKK